MNTKSYQYILSFFFYLAVLGALTACGGGGGGGGGNSTPTPEDQKPACNDDTHFCGEGEPGKDGVSRVDCNMLERRCDGDMEGDNQGTGIAYTPAELILRYDSTGHNTLSAYLSVNVYVRPTGENLPDTAEGATSTDAEWNTELDSYTSSGYTSCRGGR